MCYNVDMDNKYLILKDLKVLIEESEDSIDDIAKRAGVSSRTIDNILSGNVTPNNDIIDKIYSCAYDDGYRFNKIKEEIYKETYNEKVLFHGASKMINEIRHDGSRDNCDFGNGFYLGETYSQASSFVYDVPFSSVYAFTIDLNGLKVIEFETDIEWMLLVCYFRKMINEYANNTKIVELLNRIKDVDVIIAPIADNKMFNIMHQFGDGDITTVQAIHSLATSGLGKQFVLKTTKAISHLTQVERLFLSSSERKAISTLMEDRGKEIDTKLKLSKREFRGKGQYIDELFK